MTREDVWDGSQLLLPRVWTYTNRDVAAIDQNSHQAITRHDAFDRVVQVDEYSGTGAGPDPYVAYGSTFYQYTEADELSQVQDAANNVVSTITYDKLGRKLDQADGDLGTWSYSYDAAGQLIRQVDARSQETGLQYDGLGRLTARGPRGLRLISAAEIMALRQAIDDRRIFAELSGYTWTDPTLGTSTQLRAVHLTDLRQAILELPGNSGLPQFTRGAITASPPRIVYEQDLLDVERWLYGYSRPVIDPRVQYQYDQGANGIGRRTGMTDEAGTVSWTYDEVGQVKTETRVFTGGLGTYGTTTTYDALGRVATFTLPTGEQLQYGYLIHGPLTSITSPSTSYFGPAQYNALDQPINYRLGGSLGQLVTRTYWGLDSTSYPDGIACPFGSTKQVQAGSIFDLSYAYQPNGNLRRITDAVVPETLDYSYDFLDRLLSISSAGYNESVSFGDLTNSGGKIGNIQSRTPNGGSPLGYTYGDAAHVHAVTQVGPTSMSYDANGNMVSRGSQSLTYNWDNRLVRVAAPGASLDFVYDGDGRRAKKTDQAGATTVYLGNAWEKNVSTGEEMVDVYALGQLIAIKKGSTVRYVLTDHLGSTAVQLSSSFQVEARMRYSAFGEARDSGSGLVTDRRFTGQRLDEPINLYDYVAQKYDQAIGRFTQADPIVPNSLNPQALNRCSYVVNNPLRYTDPSGRMFLIPIWGPPTYFDDPVPDRHPVPDGDATPTDPMRYWWDPNRREFERSGGRPNILLSPEMVLVFRYVPHIDSYRVDVYIRPPTGATYLDYSFIVRENRGVLFGPLEAGGPEPRQIGPFDHVYNPLARTPAWVPGPGRVHARGALSPGTREFFHEMAHIEQIRGRPEGQWRSSSTPEWHLRALREIGRHPLEHGARPMESEANLRAYILYYLFFGPWWP